MAMQMKAEFEKKLSDLGFSYQSKPNEFYILYTNNNAASSINVQLICTEPVDEIKYGSRNGNVIESIGLFKFKLNAGRSESDFITFAFQNSIKHQIEYIIIPTEELKHRLIKRNRLHSENHIYKLVFWLMPDGFIYNCTDIGIEGEWYYLSQGLNGRQADRTEWNYTEFLNEWDRLKRIKDSSNQSQIDDNFLNLLRSNPTLSTTQTALWFCRLT
jgi:hypothetical protein